MVPFPTIRAMIGLAGAAALFLAVAELPPVAGQEVWRVKPPERWTAEEALRVLQNSPWAQRKDVSMPWRLPRDSMRTLPMPQLPRRPGAVDPVPARIQRPEKIFLDSARYLVRWESARPVQDAFARLAALGEEAGAQFQSPPPDRTEDLYLVTVKAIRPPQVGREPFERVGDRRLLAAARLKTEAGEVGATRVERSGVGASAALHFYFPRTVGPKPLLTNGVTKAEFVLELRRISLKAKFRLEPEWLR